MRRFVSLNKISHTCDSIASLLYRVDHIFRKARHTIDKLRDEKEALIQRMYYYQRQATRIAHWLREDGSELACMHDKIDTTSDLMVKKHDELRLAEDFLAAITQ